MLQVPHNNIRWYQFSFVIILVFCVSGSAVLLLNTFVFQSNTSTPIEDNTSYQEVVARDWMTPFNSIDNPFLSLIPFLLGLLVIFFYIPTRSSLGLSKKEGKKEILLNKFKLPERGYSIPYGKIKIRLTRKILSLKGLIGHEVLFSIQLPKNFPEKKRIFDFLTCEDMYHTSAYTIMHKTVKIRNIPMIITRTRALISMLSSRDES